MAEPQPLEIQGIDDRGWWTAEADTGDGRRVAFKGNCLTAVQRHSYRCPRLRTGKGDPIGRTIESLDWVRLEAAWWLGPGGEPEMEIVGKCARCGELMYRATMEEQEAWPR